MPVDWNEVNERRIGEKKLELRNYCSQRKEDMTPRAFEMARISLINLLDNITDRNTNYSGIPETVKRSMDSQDNVVAICSEKQAESLARTIVYKAIGDDLNLYPVTAEQKLQRTKVRKMDVCSIPDCEMVFKDCMFVVFAVMQGANFSRETMISCFKRFQQHQLNPIMARVYTGVYFKGSSARIDSLPQYSMFSADYRKAAKDLVAKNLLKTEDNIVYTITDTKLE